MRNPHNLLLAMIFVLTSCEKDKKTDPAPAPNTKKEYQYTLHLMISPSYPEGDIKDPDAGKVIGERLVIKVNDEIKCDKGDMKVPPTAPFNFSLSVKTGDHLYIMFDPGKFKYINRDPATGDWRDSLHVENSLEAYTTGGHKNHTISFKPLGRAVGVYDQVVTE